MHGAPAAGAHPQPVPSVDLDDLLGITDRGDDGRWFASHRVPPDGLMTYGRPDASAPGPRLDPRLEVMLVEVLEHGWARVRCENRWEAYVDGAVLQPIVAPAAPVPVPTPPPVRRPGGSRLLLLVSVGLALLSGIGWLAVRGDRYSSTFLTVAQVTPWIGVAVVALSLLASLRAMSTPARVRNGYDAARAALSIGAVLAVGAISGAGVGAPALVLAITVGVGGGIIEGSMLRVVAGADGHRYGSRARLPLITTFVGVGSAVLAAGLGNATLVGAGQVVGTAGVGLALGLPLGRVANRAALPAARLMSIVAALLVAGLPVLALSLGLDQIAARAQADEQQLAGVDGVYTGTVDLPAAQGSKYMVRQLNEVRLTLRNNQLTGTIRLSTHDNLNGKSMCGYERYTITGTQMKLATAGKDLLRFAGAVSYEQNFVEVPDEVCENFGFTEPAVMRELTLTVTRSGIAGEVGDGSLQAVLTEPDANQGGSTGGADDGSGGANGGGGDDSGVTPGTASDGSVVPRDPSIVAPGVEGIPGSVPLDKAADTAVTTISILLGTGALTLVEAERAWRDIARNRVPQDVLAGLGITPDHTAFRQAQQWSESKEVLNTAGSSRTIPSDSYVRYLEELERHVPGKTWKQIVAGMHESAYFTDANRPLPGTSIPLFEKGPETDGFEDVVAWTRPSGGRSAHRGTTITNYEPKYVIDPSGRKVDIGHAIAGLRSDLNRQPGLFADFMRQANTHLGDSWQEVIHAPAATWAGKWPSLAKAYAPPDQRLGNDMGIWLSDFYRQPDNAGVPLSEAARRFFWHHGTTGTATSYFE